MTSRCPARARRRVLSLPLFALIAIVGAGCNQSLFDSNPGDPDDGDQTDGEDGEDGGDGDGGDVDAGGDGGSDAAPIAECPAPCAGDAFADFSDEQGGANGRWSYLVDLDAPNGADYGELPFATWDGIDAWSAGDGGPAIASCRDQTDAACAGLSDFVLLVPGPVGGQRPSLSFRAPETATYRLSGAVRAAEGAAQDVPVQLVVSRAGRHDALAVQSIRTSPEETALAALVPAIVGDEIVVTIGSAEEAPPVGVRVFLTRVDGGDDAFPGSCQLAARFDADSALVEGCRAADIRNFTDGKDPKALSVPGPGPSERLGDGRVLVESQFLIVGNSPMDYSGDFTVQFWARLGEGVPSFDTLVFADFDSAVDGGLGFILGNDETSVDACFMRRDLDNTFTCVSDERPTDGLWHFWRVVRSTADETFVFCIDGVERGRVPVDGASDMTSDIEPNLGRNPFSGASFVGSLDEVRVFSEALPCATPLR